MKFTITDAAKQLGKSRTTLYRHMDSGKLSYSQSATGERNIDITELQRVYGFKLSNVTGGTKSDVTQSYESEHLATRENEQLKARLDSLEHQLELAHQEKAKLLEIIQEQNQTMKVLNPPKLNPWWRFW